MSFILKNVSKDLKKGLKSESQVQLSRSILIDFGGSFKDLSTKVGLYLDLSCSGDLREAMKNYYSFLRDVEEEQEMDRIFIVDLNENKHLINKNADFIDSLQDKIFRSCEGHFAVLTHQENNTSVYLV